MNHSRSGALISLLAAGVVVLSGCSAPHTTLAYASVATVECGGEKILTGSGSSAQSNAVKRFDEAYQNACPGRTVEYTPSGSGAGISDFLAGKSDFAGSDSPLAGDQYAEAKQRCGGADAWNLPVVFGPLAVTYNLHDVDFLVLDAPTLANIFNGTIKRWDDPAISALNASMPSEDIHVISAATPPAPPTTSSATCSRHPAGHGTRVRARPSSAAPAPALRATKEPRRW